MPMKCEEILKLKSLKDKIKVVAGKKGLKRNVRWVHFAEIIENACDITKWLFGGELLFLTGLGFRDNAEALKDLIINSHKKNLSGIVISIGKYINEIPKDILSLADELSLPLFEIPWDIRFVEITREICSSIIMKDLEEKSLSNLLEEILFSSNIERANLIERASFNGYDLSRPHMVSIIDIDNFKGFLEEFKLKNEQEIIKIKSEFHQITINTFSKYGIKVPSLLRSDAIIMLLPDMSCKINTFNIFKEIKSELKNKLNGLSVTIGVGNVYDNIKGYRESFDQAIKALEISKFINNKDNIYIYKDLGIYNFLLSEDRKKLENFFNDTLGKLVEYDKINNLDLVNTLYNFLKENKNMVNTSTELFIHRNTLRYRLNKITDILGCDLDNMEDCFNIIYALKIGQILGLISEKKDNGED